MKSRVLCQALFVTAMCACASYPILKPHTDSEDRMATKPSSNWIESEWNREHNSVIRLPLSRAEQGFAKGFPGYIAKFTDGHKVWVIRHTLQPTRMLHSAIDCYRGLGYKVSEQKVIENHQHQRWRCFVASNPERVQVCERILDPHGNQWTDVSAWYWETLFHSKNQEWWAITEVSKPMPWGAE